MERPGWSEPRGLLAAALWAVGSAACTRAGGLPVAALMVCIAAGLSVLRKRAGPWVLAVPAALGAIELPAPVPVPPRPGPVRIDGVVLAGVRVDPLLGRTRVRIAAAGTASWMWCTVRGDREVLPGDRLRSIARALPSLSASRSGEPPRVLVEADALRVDPGPPSCARFLDAGRLRLQRALLEAVPGEAGILLCHLVLGRGPALPDDLSAAHRATGLTHLLAVSGAHASVLGWMVGALYAVLTGRRAVLSRVYRWSCAAFLVAYGAITGMEPPVFRALAAFFLIMFAQAQGRRVSPCAALAFPALLTAVFAPRDLFGASFNLSYAAVLGLSLAGAFRARTFAERWLRLPLLGSCWATLLTMPLTLHYFGQVAPWTILATPLLAPLVALLLAGGLSTAALALVSAPAALVLADPLRGAAAVYCTAVRALAQLPCAPILAVSHPAPAVLAGCAVAGGALVLAWPGRRTVAAACALLSLPYFFPPPARPAAIELLGVGHGQACLARLPEDRVVLVDCGTRADGYRPAVAVEAALRPRRSLDLLVLTHDHFDHTGGVLGLLRRVRIACAALPSEMLGGAVASALAARGVELVPLSPGSDAEPLPGVRLTRPAARGASTNDGSIWAHLQLAHLSVLATGDPLEGGVAAWLGEARIRPADVLVLPHHGSANAELNRLLDAVQPRLALVSCAPPGGTAQARAARERGVTVLETGSVGSIRVRDEEPAVVETELPLRMERR
jgi:competence protein ComEC